VVRLLLEKGADIEAADMSEQTVLCVAAENGHKLVVQLLIKERGDIEKGVGKERLCCTGRHVVGTK
jgi:ankyrin repeat protein